MPRALPVWIALLLAPFASPTVHADEVHLEGGRVIEGKAVVEGEKLVIALESGSIAVPMTSVRRVERGASALEDAEKRESALKPNDVAGLMALADFCRAHELRSKERTLLARVIALTPEHEAARRRLGYVRTEQGWVDRSELVRQQERERLATRKERLALDQKNAELSLTRAQIERERATTDRERAERERLEASARERPPVLAYPYAPYAWGLPYRGRSHLGPQVTPPSGPPAFGINGVRDPRDMSFSIPGVRSPQSYFDEAQRRR